MRGKSGSRVSVTSRYLHCSLEAARPGAPPDTSYYLGFYVDARTLETVYVDHPVCC